MVKSLPVDVHVGVRMRQRRSLLGMSQTAVGRAVDLTFQQFLKSEFGSNRIFEMMKAVAPPAMPRSWGARSDKSGALPVGGSLAAAKMRCPLDTISRLPTT